MPPSNIWVVTSPVYVAALIVTGNQVTEAAPILRWTLGWYTWRLQRYFARRGFDIQAFPDA